MKWIAPLFFMAAVGCGTTDNKNQDQGVGLDGGGADLSGAAGDLKGSGVCSVSAQTGCNPGQKCVPNQGGTMANPILVGGCVTEGTAAEGQPCMVDSSSMTALNDNCKAGLYCDNDGPASAFACRKFCANDAACTAGQKCANFFGDKYGVCFPSCTPTPGAPKGDCATGDSCASLWPDQAGTMANQLGFFVCKKDGAGALYSSCGADADCGAGLACDFFGGPNKWCAPICDGTHMCPMPPADGGVTESCKTYPNTNGVGFCAGM